MQKRQAPWLLYPASVIGTLRVRGAVQGISDVVTLEDGPVLMASGSHLIRGDGDRWQIVYSEGPDNNFRRIVVFDGVILVGTGRGLLSIRGGDSAYLMRDTVVDWLSVAADGRLWVGASEGGLWHCDRTWQWQHVPLPPGHPNLAAMHVGPRGTLWIAARPLYEPEQCQIFFQEDGRWRPHAPALPLRRRNVTGLLDDGGRLWAATFAHGLWRCQDGAWSHESRMASARRPGLPGKEVDDVLRDAEGRLWAVAGGRLALHRDGVWWPVFLAPGGWDEHGERFAIVQESTSVLRPQPDGRLWFSSSQGVVGWIGPGALPHPHPLGVLAGGERAFPAYLDLS